MGWVLLFLCEEGELNHVIKIRSSTPTFSSGVLSRLSPLLPLSRKVKVGQGIDESWQKCSNRSRIEIGTYADTTAARCPCLCRIGVHGSWFFFTAAGS